MNGFVHIPKRGKLQVLISENPQLFASLIYIAGAR